jgi:hypothetical protein
MIGRTLNYISHHAIAILALVCSLLALAGASYAATQLSKNSVGSAQIKPGAVTPGKLSGKQFGGYVALYAKVNVAGKILYASPAATVTHWNSSSTGTAGTVAWHEKVSYQHCSALATPSGSLALPIEASIGPAHNGTEVSLLMGGPNGVTVAVVC